MEQRETLPQHSEVPVLTTYPAEVHSPPPALEDSKCSKREGTHSGELRGDPDAAKVNVNTNSHMGKSIRFKASSGITKRVLYITTQAFLCQ